MSLHAEPFAKVFVSASTSRKVAALGAHHAEIAGREFSHTGKAITLTEALFRQPTAVTALDLAVIYQLYCLPNIRIQMNFFIAIFMTKG